MIFRTWKDLDYRVRDTLVIAPALLLALGAVTGGVFYFAPETVTRPAGEVKSLLLHHSSFSTITTLETTEGWYQLEGAVSGARGDIVSIQTTAGYQKACLKSKDSKGCYDFR